LVLLRFGHSAKFVLGADKPLNYPGDPEVLGCLRSLDILNCFVSPDVFWIVLVLLRLWTIPIFLGYCGS
jgi:hypothetical protein